ncbi:ABC-three component system middle component 5, partial [Acinetobacter sp. TY1]|uniref:ABC-three component system middle component 5 n=1 Tax=Acinetobacter sp. TY1 TaxID=3387626 RepID=UPI003AF6EFD1
SYPSCHLNSVQMSRVLSFKSLCNKADRNSIYEIDKILIIDFYMAYPGCIRDFKFPKELHNIKKEFNDLKKDYRNPINNLQTFQRISILQKKALSNILSQGYFEIDHFKKGYLKVTNKKLSDELILILKNFSFYGDRRLPLLLILSFLEINTNGENGLKFRSGLMEYRYEDA